MYTCEQDSTHSKPSHSKVQTVSWLIITCFDMDPRRYLLWTFAVSRKGVVAQYIIADGAK